ncbi:uridine kinase [Lachnoclostridium phytofermentans]|uniref:Uridine kinase n=1 Tax=Lachnoclostridium phytofermentans (strain ATCC 700394 / DSM 18823 / ISDg) TaxID=357809 RepID=A9KLK3_LACP7|nr:uridine kinase [Lachnoclostridium phytofermentans]ABX42747.1 uridine kinase [Lachnoclostridium phytofermentans ISDg]
MKEVIVIGVAGGSASGKTTVAARLKEEYNDNVELICHDSYYLAHDDMPFDERVKINYDHPNAFDTERMLKDIRSLKQGIAIDCPVYSYSEHNRTKETVHIRATKVIIIEGFLIFENKELRDLMDIKIFVDTDADERLVRRILRDVKERGRSLESVITQYIKTVKPMHEQFVEPTKKHADIIIPRGGENQVALQMVMNRIKAIVEEETKN